MAFFSDFLYHFQSHTCSRLGWKHYLSDLWYNGRGPLRSVSVNHVLFFHLHHRAKREETSPSVRQMSSLALLYPLFMRWGCRKRKGQTAVKVQDQRPRHLSLLRYIRVLITHRSVKWGNKFACFWSKLQLPGRRLRFMWSAIMPTVFTTQQERKWKRHVFTGEKTRVMMDDNSSIVALSHILGRHIMRPCYCFLQLLWSCPNMKFVLWISGLHWMVKN